MRRIAALCWFGAAAAVPLYGAQIWARGARAFLCFFYFLCGGGVGPGGGGPPRPRRKACGNQRAKAQVLICPVFKGARPRPAGGGASEEKRLCLTRCTALYAIL